MTGSRLQDLALCMRGSKAEVGQTIIVRHQDQGNYCMCSKFFRNHLISDMQHPPIILGHTFYESYYLAMSNYPARACASKGLCDRSWRLYIVVVVYCILYISLHFFLEPIFYLPKYSLSEVYFNRDRLLIEFNGLWYSLAARQVFAAIANPDSLSFG